jgi:hypothetical protein
VTVHLLELNRKHALCLTLNIKATGPTSRIFYFWFAKNHANATQLLQDSKLLVVTLGGLVVNVLATRPKVLMFQSGQGRWIFWAMKIHTTTSFGGKVKPSVLVVRF